ncbi:thioredoxin family protein [Macrococcus sp. DPC7161]|uniref:thioredoxin family protein n=1 Tax=Macrococcus sp. DPC7161 TaxID=2507060 RepID=UPI00100BF962|nr:thioredoxin family protein [Macrococcus sp. DPC7161]RXK17481.1 thioredoxin [Macrococcus sp. DPC7161]
MEQINDYNQLMESTKQEVFVLYVMSEGCSVCHADLPRVEALLERYPFPNAKMMVNEVPEAAGQLSLFTSPVVIVFAQGREFHRQARIIDFSELEHRLNQLKELMG